MARKLGAYTRRHMPAIAALTLTSHPPLARLLGAPALVCLAGLAGLVGLAGCASERPAGGTAAAVRPAPDGPTARLLLRGAVPGEDRYALFTLADSQQCKGPRLLAGGDAKKGPDPASLAAGVLTTLDFAVLRANAPSCVLRWSFTPEAGKTYLVQGMAVGTGCSARLLDASVPDRPLSPPDAVLRSLPGQPCVPLAQARTAAAVTSLIQGGQHNGDAVLVPNATTRDLQGLIRP